MFLLSSFPREDFLFNGIYRISCSANNKFYIGSCAAKDFTYTRLVHHRESLRLNKHPNKYLQRAYNKYGEDCFFVDLIEICSPESCIEREQWWIDSIHPHYNLCRKAGSSLGRVFTEESKRKMSESQKKRFEDNPELRKKLSDSAKKRVLSEEQKQRMKEGRERKGISQETRDKLSKANKGRVFTEEWKAKLRKPKIKRNEA